MASMLTAADGQVISYHTFYATLYQRLNEIISVLSNPSTSKEKRSKAESEFNSCTETDLNTVVDKLVNLLDEQDSLDIVRKKSAILLGKIFEKSKSTQTRVVKDCLLECVVKEENRPIIEILGEIISKLAPDKKVANTLLDRLASDDTSVQESTLLIFPQLVQYVYDCKVPYMTRLHDVFMNCLGNLGSANVRIAALIAATSFIQRLKSLSRFQDLLPGMMKCLAEVLNGGDEAMTQKALVLLIELAETKPSFFTEHLVEVVGSMSQIADTESLEEGTRNLAIKFLITLNEAHAPDTSMPDMLEIVGNLRQFRLQEGIASDQTRTPAIEKLLKQFREKLPPKTWASTWSSLRLESILAHKEN